MPCAGGLSLLQLPLAVLAVLGLPGSEFKRGQWAFRLLGLALFGLSACALASDAPSLGQLRRLSPLCVCVSRGGREQGPFAQ